MALHLAGRRVPVVLPRRDDPRLRVSAVIIGIQVLGQLGLGFKVSVAQILVCIGTCAVIDVVVAYRREHALVWPASAILTGNGTALILRTAGTRAGDPWSLNGIEFFVLAALLGILSKHLVRPHGRHIFNPSNLGLVLCLLLVGPPRVYPQYLWWGPPTVPLALAWGVILAGGVWVLRPLRMLPMVGTFLLTFVVAIAGFAAGGRCFEAVWRTAPACGTDYVVGILGSPELMVFVLFMLSDPRTAPRPRSARNLYGALTALVAAALLVVQPTEYGVKVAILASLTIVCFLVRSLEGVRDRRAERASAPRPRLGLAPSVALAAVVAAVAPIMVLGLASNQQLIDADRGGVAGQPGRLAQ